MKSRVCLIFLLAVFNVNIIYAQNYNTDKTPNRIILNLTTDPATSMAVTWRTTGKISDPKIRIAPTTDWTEIDSTAAEVNAVSTQCLIDSTDVVYHYSAIITGLKPGTQYSYKVGCKDEWSEWNQFTTAQADNSPFEFIFWGDPQSGVKSFVSRIFRKGFETVPNAKFWLFTGDLLNVPNDKLWNELFYAGGFIFSTTPSIMTPGSHEYYFNSKGKRVNEFTPLWNAHFTLPENGIAGLEERSYYIDYQGVRIIMLDSQAKLKEQGVWLDKVLSENRNKWTIVATHEPFFSMGGNRDQRHTRDAFMEVIDKYSVDLVLTGHDHVYSRSYKLKNMNIVKDNEPGTVYVVSDCGAKTYDICDVNKKFMQKTGDHLQLFQKISVDGNKLFYKSYSVTGELFDSFELEK